jgi:hypothetical protein
MPYLPYSGATKNWDGSRKWKLREIKCWSCLGLFTTRDPNKMYCSNVCSRVEAQRRRRLKRKAEKERNDKIIQQTKKELGYEEPI